MRARYSVGSVSFWLTKLFVATLNRLLGHSDAVSDIKRSFVQTLCMPRKLVLPHGHIIKDMMMPAPAVVRDATVNPRLLTKSYRLEPKIQEPT